MWDGGLPASMFTLVMCSYGLAFCRPRLLTICQLQVRGLANGAAATANWVTNAVVSQLFLALADYIGGSGVFWLLACIAFGGGFWVHFYLPETKGALLWLTAYLSVALLLPLELALS